MAPLPALARRWFASAPVDAAALCAAMQARPAKAIYDVLSPMPSHLLNISLSDHLPAACSAATFSPAASGDPFALPAASSSGYLPAGHQLVHFPLQRPPSRLMPDGTDPDHAPGGPFASRRLWAGGAMRFVRPQALRLDGRRAVCVERLGAVRVQGAVGAEKAFVDVWRRYGPVDGDGDGDGDGASAVVEAAVEADPAVEERRTLVFLRDGLSSEISPPSPPPPRIIKAPHPPDYAFSLTPSAALLFHFSALSFNAHAIHLDRQFCRDVEGYRGLLVHGPLLLVLMLSALRAQVKTNDVLDAPAIRSIEYRNLAPLYAGEPLRVCLRRKPDAAAAQETRWDVWVEGPQGGLAVRGTALTAAVPM